ncbi:E3 ubiquitin-protein ligase TRIM62-like [Poecilia latipinna]|uniref:E3 ubiquitin-protein ligase TRIM62-like n=1 Tax=Poecilia latipinna TaxID=48699 RepID=A0A3B3TQE5_9TELE|nr:PREDICTED: E3 ubiquitin-protein ligase TRIM62-like [Poecilia latipinna]
MSSASCRLSEDQFLCSICLDLFTDPVTTSCGHNFCKTCITQHWDVNKNCQCPNCKKDFSAKPELEVNTLLSEMVDQFRLRAQQEASSSSEQQAAKPGEVPCDVCTGPKLKALKSCLVCLTSYCQTHLEPHLTAPRLKKHQLMEPVENLEDRMCLQHDKPLELFCRTDQTCVCLVCSVFDHKNHEFVPLREESEGKKAELRKTEAEVQEMIQERRLKIQEIRESVKISRDAADREKAEGVQVFTALMESAERGLKELLKEIQDKQETTEKQAEDFIRDLEQEISELKKRSSEVKQLSQDEDPLHLLQSCSSLKAAPPTKTWTEVRVHSPHYEGTAVRAVAQLQEILFRMNKLFQAELQRVQKFAAEVTLDPETAHQHLILSPDGKQVSHGDMKTLPDNPKRFSVSVNVLGRQSFSSGRFYFEVCVKGKTHWTVGVARESIDRKGKTHPSPQKGYWTVGLRTSTYKAFSDPAVQLPLLYSLVKVGVFVDYDEGLVSFHDVYTEALIFSFTGCSFAQKLQPFFSPGPSFGGGNAAPLMILSVSKTDRIKNL